MGVSPVMEKNTLPSETIPDMAMSIREIMQRFVNGTLDDIQLQGDYTEDLPDVRGLDPVEINSMLNSAKERYQTARDNVTASAEETRKVRKAIKEKEIEEAKIVE